MDVALLTKLLSALNIVIIEQGKDGSFQIFGGPPDWFKHLFNYVKLEGKNITVTDELSFLGCFITDATEFWGLQQAGQILWSGPWEEKLESDEYAILEAGAIYLEGRNLLIIRLFGHHVIAGPEIIQKIKEQRLSLEETSRTSEEIRKYKDYLEQEVQRQILQVRRTEDNYRRLFDSMMDAFVAIEMNGKIIEFNKTFSDMMGYSAEELYRINHVDITPEKWHAFESKIIEEQVLEKGASDVYEKEYRRKNGTVFPVELRTFLLTDEADNPTGMWMIVRDITERKKMEQQLLVAQKLASVGELAAGVIHEINNPLTAIVGYAQLLVENPDVPHDVKDDLQKIHEQSQRTVKIVHNLLSFARQHKSERKLVNINELVKQCLELEAYKLRAWNINVSTHLATNLPLVLADYGQLQQVVLNIITNAQQAITEIKGEGKITVTTDASNGHVKISIADDGPGIPPENIPKIFDPFFTTKSVGIGTGLGLSVCYGIVTDHEGKIHVESTPGEGATFIIELPVATREEAVIKKKTFVEGKSHRLRQKTQGKLLVVEDEPGIRSIMQRNLSTAGYQVQAVADGRAALNELANNAYELIIADFKIPDMSGRELHEKIKDTYPNLAGRIVFITGDIMAKDTRDYLISTGCPYLPKPFDPGEMIELVAKLLKKDPR